MLRLAADENFDNMGLVIADLAPLIECAIDGEVEDRVLFLPL